MFANIKVNIPSADRQVERERERERDACVLFEFRQIFFTLGSRLRISKFACLCRSLQKSDRTRCLAVSIFEYNINWKGRTK